MIESWGAAVESGFCFTSSAVSEIVELGGGSLFPYFRDGGIGGVVTWACGKVLLVIT